MSETPTKPKKPSESDTDQRKDHLELKLIIYRTWKDNQNKMNRIVWLLWIFSIINLIFLP